MRNHRKTTYLAGGLAGSLVQGRRFFSLGGHLTFSFRSTTDSLDWRLSLRSTVSENPLLPEALSVSASPPPPPGSPRQSSVSLKSKPRSAPSMLDIFRPTSMESPGKPCSILVVDDDGYLLSLLLLLPLSPYSSSWSVHFLFRWSWIEREANNITVGVVYKLSCVRPIDFRRTAGWHVDKFRVFDLVGIYLTWWHQWEREIDWLTERAGHDRVGM